MFAVLPDDLYRFRDAAPQNIRTLRNGEFGTSAGNLDVVLSPRLPYVAQVRASSIPLRSVRKILTERNGHNLRRDGQPLSPELVQFATRLYYDEAMSLADVARQINTTIHTIRKVLEKGEVSLRGRYDRR